MPKTAIFKNDLFLAHDPGPGHVEAPERLAAIYAALRDAGNNPQLVFADFQPVDTRVLAYTHDSAYIEQVAATAGRPHVNLDPDTRTSPDSYQAACLAAGAVVEGVRMVVQGEIDNGFALVRPPGHHAERDEARGFCLFNNVAVAANYAIKDLGLARVMIVDWDLHHGNGTQHSFYDTDKVLYFSTHQYPYYPGTGSLSEGGRGKGEGYTVNVPLPGGQGDEIYGLIFRDLLAPIARQYQPELIIVSAGFDIYFRDPLGTMGVTEAGFACMTRILHELAVELCGGRLLLALEGGYNLEGLSQGVMACLDELTGKRKVLTPEKLAAIEQVGNLNDGGMGVAVVAHARKFLKSYWRL